MKVPKKLGHFIITLFFIMAGGCDDLADFFTDTEYYCKECEKQCSTEDPVLTLVEGQEFVEYEYFGSDEMNGCLDFDRSEIGDYIYITFEEFSNKNKKRRDSDYCNFVFKSIEDRMTQENKVLLGKDVSTGGCDGKVGSYFLGIVQDNNSRTINAYFYGWSTGGCAVPYSGIEWLFIDRPDDAFKINLIASICHSGL